MDKFNSDDQSLLEPPRYDMLTIKFRGDSHEVVLPYIEVANGNIVGLTNTHVEIAVYKPLAQDEDTAESVKMTHAEFIMLIESTFDTKEITRLALQRAESYDNIELL
jgi:hypothetical protein